MPRGTLFLLTAILVGNDAVALEGDGSDEDAAGFVQILPRPKHDDARKPLTVYNCSDCLGEKWQPQQVCDIPEATQRCKTLNPFALSGGGLVGGIMGIGVCTKNWTVPKEDCADFTTEAACPDDGCFWSDGACQESCFHNETIRKQFAEYAKGYAENGGTHMAFTWKDRAFTRQPNRKIITEYYYQLIGRNSKDFGLAVVPEAVSPEFSVQYNSCTVLATDDKPGYLLFGFWSATINYGTGVSILNKAGYITRQVATAYGPDLVQDESTPGFETTPTSFDGNGPAATTLRKYMKALKKGDSWKMASFYDREARLNFFNYDASTKPNVRHGHETEGNLAPESNGSFQVFVGIDAIERHTASLINFFVAGSGVQGGKSKAVTIEVVCETGEEYSAETAAWAYVAYEVDGNAKNRLAQVFTFTKEGKIYGQGTVGAVEGLSLADVGA